MNPTKPTPLFLEALAKKPTPRPPIWMMRQAGRYLPEYLALKQKKAHNSFLTMLRSPSLATEITLQPWERFGVDALILFSDILTILPPMGLRLDFVPQPKLEKNALEYGIDRLVVPDPAAELAFVGATIAEIKRHSASLPPLIGFAGGPFTTACYALASSKFDAGEPKKLFFQEPKLFHTLLDKISATLERYLSFQIESGADAIMLFDSWIGNLSKPQFEDLALPYLERILERLRPYSRPIIYFGLASNHLLESLQKLKVDALGLDWRVDLSLAKKLFSGKFALQGNLDNSTLFADPKTLEQKTAAILDEMAGYPGFIFNLGHGVLPQTPVENVAALVKQVQAYHYANASN